MVSLQLADFGADVIKIEDPKKGDPLRAWQTDGISVDWKVYSRNKKSVALSLRDARGRELLLDLAATAQVLIENFRPGTLEGMGLGPNILHRRNPALIIVRVSGWGQDGPYRDRPGFGTLVESMSGYAARTGFADREPALPPTALADMVAGLYGAMAVLVALREVEAKGGRGQVIDLPHPDRQAHFGRNRPGPGRPSCAVEEQEFAVMLETYEGGCHCGRVRFRVRADLSALLECNCSICTKKGILHLIVPPEQFELLSGDDALTTYQFNTNTARHTFCSHCGMHPFYTPRSHPDHIDVNARCLDGVDVAALRPRMVDGRDWEATWGRHAAEGP
jgi:hypothetical protein